MEVIKELLLAMIYGFKRIFMWITIIAFTMSLLWGTLSAMLTIFGSIEFQWWYIPFWALVVCMLAACLGQDRD